MLRLPAGYDSVSARHLTRIPNPNDDEDSTKSPQELIRQLFPVDGKRVGEGRAVQPSVHESLSSTDPVRTQSTQDQESELSRIFQRARRNPRIQRARGKKQEGGGKKKPTTHTGRTEQDATVAI